MFTPKRLWRLFTLKFQSQRAEPRKIDFGKQSLHIEYSDSESMVVTGSDNYFNLKGLSMFVKKTIIIAIVASIIFSGSAINAASASAAVQSDRVNEFGAPAENNSQTLTDSKGNVLEARLIDSGLNVEIYLNGEYQNTVSVRSLQQKAREISSMQHQTTFRSRCGHILNGIAIANSALWAAAGVSAGMVNPPGAIVTAAGGIVTSAILGYAGAECKD